MLFGEQPFESHDKNVMNQRILVRDYIFPETIKVSNEAKKFINELLVINPEKRLTAN